MGEVNAELEAKRDEARNLISKIEQGIKDDFKRAQSALENPNTQGEVYEKIVLDVLKKYLSGSYDFYNRAKIIDSELNSTLIFGRAENEIDILATFKGVSPNILWEEANRAVIPFDTVAYLIEVKAKLDKTNLSNDLEKLRKITKLKITEDRFSGYNGGKYVISNRPLKILFYFNEEIDSATCEQILAQNEDDWDVVVILMSDKILLNTKLELTKDLIPIDKRGKGYRIFGWGGRTFLHLMEIILLIIPRPFNVVITKTIINIEKYSDSNGN
jgi:hypothetical protein